MDCRTGILRGAKKAVLRIGLCGVLALAAASAVFGSSFVFPDFSSPGGQIALNQDAAFATDSLSRSVLRVAPEALTKYGSAWYVEPVLFADGFSTTFTFRMSRQGTFSADGFAFVIQADPAGTLAIGGAGGTIGFGFPGLYNSAAVEFDTYFNVVQTLDPNDNHVAIFKSLGANPIDNVHSTANMVQTDTDPGVILSGGADHLASILYSPGWLSVRLDDALLFGGPVSVDLAAVIGSPTAYVGFTAATGSGFQDHDIVNWTYQSVPEPASFALLGTGLALIVIFASRRKK